MAKDPLTYIPEKLKPNPGPTDSPDRCREVGRFFYKWGITRNPYPRFSQQAADFMDGYKEGQPK